MHIFGTPIRKVSMELLDRLAEEHAAESLTHDYKNGLPSKGENLEKTDLLGDLASFANSAGGVLVIGFDEATWTISGVAGWDDGLHPKRIDDLARNTVPTLPRLRHRTITRNDGSPPVALVGIPRSLSAPHAVNRSRPGASSPPGPWVPVLDVKRPAG
jgi:predicted HTH transcriptional regulator